MTTEATAREHRRIEAETAAQRSVVQHHKDYGKWVQHQVDSADEYNLYALRRDCLGLAFRWFEGIASPRGLYLRPEDEPDMPSWSAVTEVAERIEEWVRGDR